MAVPAQIAPRAARSAPKHQKTDDSVLNDLISVGGSGLQYAGETLNKVSRGTWGSANYLAGGEAGGGLLNLIPFSDTMGLTDPRKGIELSGFLENRGLLPKNQPGFDWYDPVRVGADIGGDLTTYAGGLGLLKSFGKGGHVLSKASPAVRKLSRVGRMTTTVNDLAKQIPAEALQHAATRSGFADTASFLSRHGQEPIGGLVSLNRPFGSPLKAIGTGRTAQKIGGGLDRLLSGSRPAALAFGPQRARALSEMESAFGPKAGKAMELHDAYATKWAQQTGKGTEDYFSRLKIRKGDPLQVGAEALRQTPATEVFEPWTPPVDSGRTIPLGSVEFDGQGMREDSAAYWKGREIPQDKGDWQSLPKLLDADGRTTIIDGRHRIQEARNQGKPSILAVKDTWDAEGNVTGREFVQIDLRPEPAPQAIQQLQTPAEGTVMTEAQGYFDKHPKATNNQIIAHAKRNGLDHRQFLKDYQRARAARKATLPSNRPVGEELEEQRRRSAEGVRKSNLQRRREERSQERFAGEVDSIHDAMLKAGWKLNKESESGSRYYSRGNELARVSDHAANEATRAWIDKNGVREISRLEDVPEALQQLQQPGRGAVEFTSDNQQAIVTAFQSANISTLAHESAHVFRRWLGEMDQTLLRNAEQALGVSAGKWTREAEEAFASGFERYLRDGQAPTSALRSVFESFKNWLAQVYQSLKGTPLEQSVHPQLKRVFDQMLTPRGARKGLLNTAPVRHAAALFNRSTRGATSQAGAMLGEAATEAERAAQVGAREAFGEPLRMFEEYAQTLPDMKSRLDAHDALTAAAEGVRPLPQEMARLQPAVDAIKEIGVNQVPFERSEGLASTALDDIFIDYAKRSRFFFPGDKSKGDLPSMLLSGKHGSQIERKDILRDIAGGTSLINRLSIDPALSGIAHGKRPAEITKELWDQQERLVNAAMRQAGYPNGMYEHSRELARWLADLDPRHVSEQVPVFAHNPIETALRRKEIGDRAVGMARAIREAIGQAGNNFTRDDAPVNAVRASDVFSRAGLDPQKSLDLLHEQFRGRPASVLREGAEQHRQYGTGATDWASGAKAEADRINQQMVEMVEQAGGDLDAVKDTPEFQQLAQQWETLNDQASAARGIAGSAREVASGVKQELNDVWIPKELAADILRVAKSFQAPEEVAKVVELLDKFTALFKVGVLTFPARYTRDWMSGQVQNFLTGAWSYRSMRDMDKLIRGRGPITGLQELGGAYAHLSDEAATRKFAQEMFAHDVTSTSQGITSQGEVAGTSLSRSMATEIPGVVPLRFRQIVSKARPRTLAQANPLNIGGVRGTETVNSVAAAGKDLGHLLDANIRGTGYLELRRKGWSPERAAERIRLTQVDYKNLSSAEQSVIRRALPFYAYSRGMAEFLVKELAERPGGGIGQTIRAANQGRGEGPMPEYIAQGMAVPLGTQPDGTQSFLTGAGLMHEDTLSLLGPDTQGMLAELGSRLAPQYKFPIEYATGESLFQRGPMGGRDVLDQDPTIGRLISNVGELAGQAPREFPGTGRAKPFLSTGFEQLAANLPTSRLMTTLRTATDRRKLEGGLFPGSKALINIGTGFRISDLSPQAQDAMLRDELAALTREEGGKAFESVRFSKAQIAAAEKESPEKAARMLALNAAAAELAKRAKARKKIKPPARSVR